MKNKTCKRLVQIIVILILLLMLTSDSQVANKSLENDFKITDT
ncbi:hypothetical protein [Agaribacter flavus]|uniref:Uncharacterized protein n=1 Tax=Agaribacter flavus TaxID=1902781 RepID=A0ABV7FTP8_9ALTE